MAQSSSIGGNHFLLLILFLPFLCFIFKKLKASASASSNNIPPFPPGPTPWPLLGNIPQMVNKMPHIALSDLSKIHGPFIMLKLGTQNMVVASSPAAAKEILKTNDRVLSARYVPKSIPITQQELHTSSIAMNETCNEKWKYLRALCRAELFSVRSLDAQSCLREKKVLDLVEYIKSKNVGEIVNIGELVFVTVFNMLSSVLFSCDLIQYDEKNEDVGLKGLIKKTTEIALAPNISDLYPILSKLDIQGLRRTFLKIQMKIEAIYEPIIEERRNTNSLISQNDFLNVLFMNKFSDAHSCKLIMELISAGTDSSTSTVEWTLAELTKNSESKTKVIEELEREIGTDQIKESDLEKLPYLQACIKETLRLHPPAPLLLPRRAMETCQVMNYTIPKNAQVYINIWAIGRDPSIWDEPLLFKPERFLNCAVDFKGNDFEFIPFGGGRRICPGLPMAGRQIYLVLATLLHSFEWTMPKEKSSQELDMTEKFSISLQKEKPLLLIPKLKNQL